MSLPFPESSATTPVLPGSAAKPYLARMLATSELLEDAPTPSTTLEDDDRNSSAVDDDELKLLAVDALLCDEDDDELKLLELWELVLLELIDVRLDSEDRLDRLDLSGELLDDEELSELVLEELLDEKS